jgi:hypothetical protein
VRWRPFAGAAAHGRPQPPSLARRHPGRADPGVGGRRRPGRPQVGQGAGPGLSRRPRSGRPRAGPALARQRGLRAQHPHPAGGAEVGDRPALDPGAVDRRRVPFLPPPEPALGRDWRGRTDLGRKRGAGLRRAVPGDRPRGSFRPDLRQPGVLQERPGLRPRRGAGRSRAAGRALGGDRRLSRLPGRPDRLGGGGRPIVLHRRRLQIRHGRRRGGVPARAAGLWPAPGPDRLVRRVRRPGRSAGRGGLRPGRRPLHGRHLRPVRPLSFRGGRPDAGGAGHHHRDHRRSRRRAAADPARPDRGRRGGTAERRDGPEPARPGAASPLPGPAPPVRPGVETGPVGPGRRGRRARRRAADRPVDLSR